MSSRSRYAHVERERRFLIPSTAAAGKRSGPELRVLEIEDRYLRGTRLRLRCVREVGRPPVRKLGQKVRPKQDHPSTVEHTTMYLEDAEAEVLLALAADVVVKTRTLHPWQSLILAVDVFAGELAGLVLAEVDLGEAAVLPLTSPPVPLLAEVTDDDRFTGGRLARTAASNLAELLRDLRVQTANGCGPAT